MKDLIKNPIIASYEKTEVSYYPRHNMCKSWVFSANPNNDNEADRAIHEANLANALAMVAEQNGLTANDLQHLFPAVLRMLKSNSNWAK